MFETIQIYFLDFARFVVNFSLHLSHYVVGMISRKITKSLAEASHQRDEWNQLTGRCLEIPPVVLEAHHHRPRHDAFAENTVPSTTSATYKTVSGRQSTAHYRRPRAYPVSKSRTNHKYRLVVLKNKNINFSCMIFITLYIVKILLLFFYTSCFYIFFKYFYSSNLFLMQNINVYILLYIIFLPIFKTAASHLQECWRP